MWASDHPHPDGCVAGNPSATSRSNSLASPPRRSTRSPARTPPNSMALFPIQPPHPPPPPYTPPNTHPPPPQKPPPKCLLATAAHFIPPPPNHPTPQTNTTSRPPMAGGEEGSQQPIFRGDPLRGPPPAKRRVRRNQGEAYGLCPVDHEGPHRRRLGAACPSVADVAVKDGKIVEIGKLSGTAAAPSTPAARLSPPASSTIIAITTRRSPGTRSARIAATTARPRSSSAIARCRWRRSGRARQERRSPNSSLTSVKRSRWRCSNTLELHLGDRFRSGSTRWTVQSRRGQCRQSDRPRGGAVLRDGRRLPEAHRHRR